jgi:predicted ArsR family transcriptional regulator
MLRKQLLDTSRGRIVALLQHGSATVEDLADRLGLTRNAVRPQLAAMERDGVVRRVGQRKGSTRPSHVFELTPEVEHLLSQAYLPLLSQLIDVFSKELAPAQVDELMRAAGAGLARQLLADKKLTGSLASRVETASALMNEQLGALTRMESNGSYVIRGAGCPLSAVTGKSPAVCRAMESFVADIVDAPVRECCERAGRPRCCFEVERQDGH